MRVVIPARFESQRLPGKPLADIAGKPMVVRVFDAVLSALAPDEVIVAVDDDRVERVLRQHEVPVLRTGRGCPSGTDRVAEVSRRLGWADSDIVLNVQGDEPLIPPELLREFVSYCRGIDAFEMATIGAPVDTIADLVDPNVVKAMLRSDGTAITFSRAAIPFDRDRPARKWDLSKYRRHIGIYAYRVQVLQQLTSTPPCDLELVERLEQLRALWLGIPIHVLDWPQNPPGGVDTQDDLDRVRALFGGDL